MPRTSRRVTVSVRQPAPDQPVHCARARVLPSPLTAPQRCREHARLRRARWRKQTRLPGSDAEPACWSAKPAETSEPSAPKPLPAKPVAEPARTRADHAPGLHPLHGPSVELRLPVRCRAAPRPAVLGSARARAVESRSAIALSGCARSDGVPPPAHPSPVMATHAASPASVPLLVDGARAALPRSYLAGRSSSSRDITGTMPTEIGLLTGLSSMCVARQCAHPALRARAFRAKSSRAVCCTQRRVDVSKNRRYMEDLDLSGTMPTEIGQLRGLDDLALENVYLSGTLPSAIQRLNRLRSLYVGSLAACPSDGLARPSVRTLTQCRMCSRLLVTVSKRTGGSNPTFSRARFLRLTRSSDWNICARTLPARAPARVASGRGCRRNRPVEPRCHRVLRCCRAVGRVTLTSAPPP